jgi:hypothetical protein
MVFLQILAMVAFGIAWILNLTLRKMTHKTYVDKEYKIDEKLYGDLKKYMLILVGIGIFLIGAVFTLDYMAH